MCHTMSMKIRVKRFRSDLPLPQTEPHAAGFDLACAESATISPHSIALVKLNYAIEVPDGYFLMLTSRSSTPIKKGLMLANAPGIVDPFFNGDADQLKIQLLNFTDAPVEVAEGEELVQCVILRHQPIEWQEVDSLGHDGHGGYWR